MTQYSRQSSSDRVIFRNYTYSLPMKEFNMDIAFEEIPVSGCTCLSTCANKPPDTRRCVCCTEQSGPVDAAGNFDAALPC